ncbi:MAG: hypothetical protein IPH20_12435 [Bacteroidales bacterium]|nr:hypothetical protein [Bacteroidales bacterium]
MTPENWDNNMVPGSSTDVVIPQNVPNMPLISDATAYCRDLILETGTALTMADNSYLNIFRDFDSHLGQFTMNGSSYLYFTGSEDTFWYSDPYDVYRNIRITKADAYTVAQSQGTIICSGTFEIREGTFTLQFLTITNLGANALEIESGGILHFLTPFSYVEVYGSCIGYSGSEILGNGSLLCKGDFTLESNASNSWLCELIMNGTGTQYIDLQYPDAELGGLVIDKPGGICYIKSGDLSVSDITIYSGTLSCNNGPSPTATYDIVCDGDFVNQAGPAGFDASAGTVEFTSWRSIISPNGTIFNNLEINLLNSNLNITGEVTCASYDWTSGGIEVDEGATFTANDLTDNAIKGTFICQEGATINLTNSGTGTFVDLAGELYNYGGTINLFGSVSYWPYGNNAKLKMTSGIIDLKTCGLNIYQTSAYTLIDSISGGIIRTANNFTCTRTDFNPEGGTFEFYGDGNTVAISQIAGSSFYNVLINKNPGNTVALSSNIRLTNNLSIQSGLFNSNNRTIQLEGDWNNTAGPDAFLEGTGRVIFTGIYPQLCSTETFNILEIDKALQYFYDQTGSSITCQVYDWTQGGIWIAGGSTFYASDLADDGIYGEYVLWGNSIELHQDAIQSIDLHGTLNINGGEFKVYGGAFQSFWGSYANAGLTMTNGVLDFVDQAILIQDAAPYSFTSNISGGIIRTQKGFMAQSPGFNPFGGMVEIYGNQNSLILAQDGAAFYNLKINISLSRLLVTL